MVVENRRQDLNLQFRKESAENNDNTRTELRRPDQRSPGPKKQILLGGRIDANQTEWEHLTNEANLVSKRVDFGNT